MTSAAPSFFPSFLMENKLNTRERDADVNIERVTEIISWTSDLNGFSD